MKTAGVFERFIARVIDGFVLLPVVVALTISTDFGQRQIDLPLGVVYDAVAIGLWSTTIGKAAMRIAVRDEHSGGRVAWWQAVARAWLVLPGIPGVDGPIDWALGAFAVANLATVLVRRDNRALHDLIVRTRVVQVPERVPAA